MDALVLKARFEEAKAKELGGVKTTGPFPKKTSGTGGVVTSPVKMQTGAPTSATTNPTAATSQKEDSNRSGKLGSKKCYNCGLEGHMARACPYPKSTREQEAHGKRRMGNVTLEDPREESVTVSRKEKITELRKELQKAELAAAIEEASGVLSVVEPMTTKPKTKLGPTLFASVTVNGVPTEALVDTGSPATIISLEFVLKVLANGRTPNQTVQEWKETTHKKFVSLKVLLRNYRGHPLQSRS